MDPDQRMQDVLKPFYMNRNSNLYKQAYDLSARVTFYWADRFYAQSASIWEAERSYNKEIAGNYIFLKANTWLPIIEMGANLRHIFIKNTQTCSSIFNRYGKRIPTMKPPIQWHQIRPRF